MAKRMQPPALCHFPARDEAVVYVGKKRVRMGKWGSEEANWNYQAFCLEWLANNKHVRLPGPGNTLADLVAAYLEANEGIIGKWDFDKMKNVARTLLEVYPDLPVEQFTPLKLKAVREKIKQGTRIRIIDGRRQEVPVTRGWINKLTNKVKAFFRWGVANEMCSVNVAEALKYVEPLRAGRTDAPEAPARREVSDAVISRTLPFLPRVVADMVTLQQRTGMRPKELCRLCMAEIDTTGEMWLYVPEKHKTSHKGKLRVVPFNRTEQEILKRHAKDRTPDEFLFSPREAMLERWAEKAAARKTPVQPSQRERAAKRLETRLDRVSACYSPESYAKAIQYAITQARKAGVEVEHWTPYQIRHTAITEVSRKHGRDAGRAFAGHADTRITAIYDHADVQIAIDVAKKREEKDAE